MHVHVGPLPSGGVALWVAYARTVLGQILSGAEPVDVEIDPDVVETFESYLDEWEAAARGPGDFLWSTEVEPEQVEFLAHTFFNIAQALDLAAEERGYPIAPPEGEEFYRALVTGFLDALTQEGGPLGPFAEELRSTWPGLEDE